MWLPIMRVIAASFATVDSARESLGRLTGEAGVRADDAQVAPHEDGFVLGVRLARERHASVCRIIEESGGRVLVDVPESWTQGTGYVPAPPDPDATPTSDPIRPTVRVHGAPA